MGLPSLLADICHSGNWSHREREREKKEKKKEKKKRLKEL